MLPYFNLKNLSSINSIYLIPIPKKGKNLIKFNLIIKEAFKKGSTQ
jgi:hypothetical protein